MKLVALLLAVALPAAAAETAPPPDTRAAQWRRLREEKARRPPPAERAGFVERQILAFEKAERPSLLTLHFKNVWPTFASLASGSRVAPGLRVWEPSVSGGAVSLHASAARSVTGYQLVDLQVGLIPHEGGRLPHRSTRGDDVYELGSLPLHGARPLTLQASLRHRDHPRERFYGLGGASRREDRTEYGFEETLAEVVAGYRVAPGLSVTGRAGFLDASSGPGGHDDIPSTESIFTEATAPGLGADTRFFRSSAQVFLDRRDVPFNPHRGVMLAAAATRFADRDGGAWSFRRLALDGRGYLPLGSVQRVLAVRAYLSSDTADDGATVPFFLQEPLSNSHTLRGYETFRYRGEKLVSLQAEYRWEAAPAVELAVFVDAGRAFRASEDVTISGLRASWGGGLRIKTWEDTLFRLDVARSPEQVRAYARFGAAF